MASDVGRVRDNNQDSCLVEPSLGLYVVCDGMGGHAAGDVASRLAVETVREVVQVYLPEVGTPETEQGRANALASLMRAALERANRAVHELSRNEQTFGAGTTCTAVLVYDSKATLAHVGDSRAYLIRDDQVHQLSNDHTFAAEAISRGLLTIEELADIPEAAALTRAIGPHPSVVVDTLLFDLLPGDTLVLCSDGLHGYLQSEYELLDYVNDAPETIANQLVAVANDRGGQDNITAVVLRAHYDEDDPTASGRSTQIASDLAALRHIDLLSELTYAELSRVSHQMKSCSFDTGDVILHEGDDTENLFVLVEGRARVDRGGKLLAHLPTGSHFGEMAMLTRRPRTATITAEEPCRVLVLDKQTFFRLAQQDAVFGVKFLWKFAQTLSLRLEESYAPHPETPEEDVFCSPFAKTDPPPKIKPT